MRGKLVRVPCSLLQEAPGERKASTDGDEIPASGELAVLRTRANRAWSAGARASVERRDGTRDSAIVTQAFLVPALFAASTIVCLSVHVVSKR